MKYYAVARGVSNGIFTSWDEAKDLVQGFPGAKYKSFSNPEDAKQYLRENGCDALFDEPVVKTNISKSNTDGGYNINIGFDLNSKSNKIVNDPKYYVNRETKYTYYQGMTYFNKLVVGFIIRNNGEVFISPVDPLIKKFQGDWQEVEAWAIKLYRVLPESVCVYTGEV